MDVCNKLILSFLFVLLVSSVLYSQTCCTAGMPVSSILDIPKADNALFLQLRYEYRSINRLVDNNKILENDPRSRSGQNISIKIDYVLNKSWAFSAILPFIKQARSSISEKQESFGIGDLTLLTQYSINSISLGAALKIPTGNVNLESSSGLLLSPDMMSGSGSFDIVFRAGYEKQSFILPFLSASLSATYKLNGTNDDFGASENFGGRRFGFGNELNIRSGLNYSIVTKSLFINPHFGLNYRTASPNTEQFVNAPNSGGHWINIPLGVSFSKDGVNTISIFSEIPIYQNLEGLQITTDYVVGLSFNYKILNNNSNKSDEKFNSNSGTLPQL